MLSFEKKVIEIASQDIGQEELKGNSGWKDKVFEAAMRSIGWHRGWAWCASWVRKVYLQAAEETWGKNSCHYKRIKKVLSHGVLRTWNNMRKSPYFEVSDTAGEGMIGCLRHGKTRGHEYIVLTIGEDKDRVRTIEGNTNCAGEREGKYVMSRVREEYPRNILGYGRYAG
jgi:hypothetical protein